MTAGRIVVGVNGTASSSAAVRWAADQARRHGAELNLVAAHQWRVPGRTFNSREDLARTAGSRAMAIVEAAAELARTRAPAVTVRAEAVVGEPVPVLLDAAAGAELLVVGGRDHGHPGPMLGAVTSQVAAYAPCSVVAVRPGDDDATATVVVGLDDSPAVSATAGIAFEQAALHPSRALLAVSAFAVPPGHDRGSIEAERRRHLADQLAPWQNKFPEISVTVDVVHDDAAIMLTRRSHQAGLLVIGAGTPTTFETLRLGPIRLHLLHHATCPVLIARTDD